MDARTVKCAELPPEVRGLLRMVGYGQPTIDVAAQECIPGGSCAGDGERAVKAAVSLETGHIEIRHGAWGGATPLSPRAADVRGDAPLAPGHVVFDGVEGGGRPVWGRLLAHPRTMAPLLPPPPAALTPEEGKALAALCGLTPAGRRDYFARERLGAYGPDNRHVRALVARGWATVNRAGAVGVTPDGRCNRPRGVHV